MAMLFETKACGACARAKRKCGKQTPLCQRCRKRGIECTYPSTKPSSFVVCGGDDGFPAEHDILPCSALQLSARSPDLRIRGVDDARLSLELDLPGLSHDLDRSQPASYWFNSPETWDIVHFAHVERKQFGVMDLRRLVRKIHRWLIEWVDNGSNPFIHSRQYRTRFPRCIQDAYTTLSCYLHRTGSNEQTVLRIIEYRAKQLLVENGIASAESWLESTSTSSATLDAFEHTARVQALLVYQILGFYDGDIRLRHLAESHIPVLNSWMRQMVESASQTACLGSSVVTSVYEQRRFVLGLSDDSHYDNLLWYSWILSESIRRTWLVAAGIQGIYLIIQQGRPASCEGGMMLTTRQGVWETQSALSWEKMCSEVNVGLIHLTEADRLFREVEPEDVNDFSKVILEATFGAEKMERWGVRIQDLEA